IVGILAAIAIPEYRYAQQRAREAVLKTDLHIFRDNIENYYADKGKYPESLDVLVQDGYLRALPVDPMTKASDSWQTVQEEPDPDAPPSEGSASASPGITDVHSGSPETGSDGR